MCSRASAGPSRCSTRRSTAVVSVTAPGRRQSGAVPARRARLPVHVAVSVLGRLVPAVSRERLQLEPPQCLLAFRSQQGPAFHIQKLFLSVVNADNGANHFGYNDHVTQMGLDNLWLLIGRRLLLGAAQFLHQSHRLALQAAGEPPAGARVHQLHELLTDQNNVLRLVIQWVIILVTNMINLLGHIKKLIQVDTSEGELPEGTLLLKSFVDLQNPCFRSDSTENRKERKERYLTVTVMMSDLTANRLDSVLPKRKERVLQTCNKMGTEVPKTHDSSGESDSNSDSQNSSSSESSGSDWECSGAKQTSAAKPHFSVTSCDTGLRLKIAAIPPRKVSPKRSAKPSVKTKPSEVTETQKSKVKKKPSKLSDSSSSSESCSKCSSDSSSDDDVPLKIVSKSLPKCSPQKASKNTKNSTVKSGSDDEKRLSDAIKDIKATKDKPSASKGNAVKKTKCDETVQATEVKKGRGRPRTKDDSLLKQVDHDPRTLDQCKLMRWVRLARVPAAVHFRRAPGRCAFLPRRGKRERSSPARWN
ncbi:hypothetical protein MSG28_012432 [Choristoneura fumiferana]|uniref:Uncharacterized protein n=1 Tax=Choristoneura fumiferana TaxID=7141 RepID=A0ACC0KE90_CHOFU|nr:hypothetical protein MSG28_012432 [Choristoneura fumiferana]